MDTVGLHREEPGSSIAVFAPQRDGFFSIKRQIKTLNIDYMSNVFIYLKQKWCRLSQVKGGRLKWPGF